MTKLYVIGLGPGSYEDMTMRAAKALASCDVIAGYTVYVDLIRDYYSDKEFLTTPMTKEEERCRLALETASAGKTTAMVCSGDAGVYGMAGLIFSMGKDYPQVEVEVIPGVTAALSGAALLGAPLIHDFVLISLSDLLTPWEKIEKRLCGPGGFCDLPLQSIQQEEGGLPEKSLPDHRGVSERRYGLRLCGQYRPRGGDLPYLYPEGA